MHADFPLPDISWPPLVPYWEAAARGELVLPRCTGCDRIDWYPTTTCAACGGEGRDWVPMSGRATLWSWAVVSHVWVPEFASLVPFTSALVAIEEDPQVRLATMVVDAEGIELVPDMPMEVAFRPLSFPPATASVVVPMFRLKPE